MTFGVMGERLSGAQVSRTSPRSKMRVSKVGREDILMRLRKGLSPTDGQVSAHNKILYMSNEAKRWAASGAAK